jgi:hypothetical protein
MMQRCARPGRPLRRAPPVRVDEGAARDVAAWYIGHRDASRDPLVRAAYTALELQTDVLLRRCLRTVARGGLRMVSTALPEPYEDDRALVEGVRETNVLEVPQVPRGSTHPLLDSGPGASYDRFRALHDLLGHVLPAFGFDRDGEFAAWIEQDQWYEGLARRALATELHGQHSVRWSTGELAEPKAILIDPQLLRASKASAWRASMTADRRCELGVPSRERGPCRQPIRPVTGLGVPSV